LACNTDRQSGTHQSPLKSRKSTDPNHTLYERMKRVARRVVFEANMHLPDCDYCLRVQARTLLLRLLRDKKMDTRPPSMCGQKRAPTRYEKNCKPSSNRTCGDHFYLVGDSVKNSPTNVKNIYPEVSNPAQDQADVKLYKTDRGFGTDWSRGKRQSQKVDPCDPVIQFLDKPTFKVPNVGLQKIFSQIEKGICNKTMLESFSPRPEPNPQAAKPKPKKSEILIDDFPHGSSGMVLTEKKKTVTQHINKLVTQATPHHTTTSFHSRQPAIPNSSQTPNPHTQLQKIKRYCLLQDRLKALSSKTPRRHPKAPKPLTKTIHKFPLPDPNVSLPTPTKNFNLSQSNWAQQRRDKRFLRDLMIQTTRPTGSIPNNPTSRVQNSDKNFLNMFGKLIITPVSDKPAMVWEDADLSKYRYEAIQVGHRDFGDFYRESGRGAGRGVVGRKVGGSNVSGGRDNVNNGF
jgi:hypothetical protein